MTENSEDKNNLIESDLLDLYFELNPPTLMTFACCSSDLLEQDFPRKEKGKILENLKKAVVDSLGKPKRKKGAKELLDEIVDSAMDVSRMFYSLAGFKTHIVGNEEFNAHTLIVKNYYNLAGCKVSYINDYSSLSLDSEIPNVIYSAAHQFTQHDHDREIFNCNSVKAIAGKFETCYEIFYKWQEANLAIAKMKTENDLEIVQKMQKYEDLLLDYAENYSQGVKNKEEKQTKKESFIN